MAFGWNPSDGVNVAVSGTDNLTVTAQSDGISAIRSVTGHSSGKWYAEITVGGTIGGTPHTPNIGIASATWYIYNALGAGSPSDSVGFRVGSTDGPQPLFYNNAWNNLGYPDSIASNGTVISFCIDLDNRRFYAIDDQFVTKFGSGGWNGGSGVDPAASFGALSLDAGNPGNLVHLAWTAERAGAIGTLNTGKTPFLRALPAGYASWDAWPTTQQGAVSFSHGLTFAASARIGRRAAVAFNTGLLFRASPLVPPIAAVTFPIGLAFNAVPPAKQTAAVGFLPGLAFSLGDPQVVRRSAVSFSFGLATSFRINQTAAGGWSSSDDLGMAISGAGSLVATSVPGSSSGVRTRISHSTGKYYAEITITGAPQATTAFTVASTDWPLATSPGTALVSESVAVYPFRADQPIYENNVLRNLGPMAQADTAGAVISIAVDIDNRQVFFLTPGFISTYGADGWNAALSNAPSAIVLTSSESPWADDWADDFGGTSSVITTSTDSVWADDWDNTFGSGGPIGVPITTTKPLFLGFYTGATGAGGVNIWGDEWEDAFGGDDGASSSPVIGTLNGGSSTFLRSVPAGYSPWDVSGIVEQQAALSTTFSLAFGADSKIGKAGLLAMSFGLSFKPNAVVLNNKIGLVSFGIGLNFTAAATVSKPASVSFPLSLSTTFNPAIGRKSSVGFQIGEIFSVAPVGGKASQVAVVSFQMGLTFDTAPIVISPLRFPFVIWCD